MTFSEKLVRLRKIKSLTQDEFASAVGVSRQAVYKWESGQSYPEVPKLLEIKMLFGISIDDLLDDTYDIPLPEKKRKKRISREDRERIEAEIRRQEGFDDEESLDGDILSQELDYTADEPVSLTDSEPISDKAVPVADITAKATEDTSVTKDDITAESTPVSEDKAAGAPEVSVPGEDEKAETVSQKKGFFGRIFGKK
ncbi:MAG: helix-turn-helix domain-containing protein [Clostridia bacterium]|nr:helix-turn-helix domain-containing protein [Clostridia bacterium]